MVTLLEGHRIVGRARVIELLGDPTPFPLRDLPAARTRTLEPPPATRLIIWTG